MQRKRKAFTLLELLIVMVIIGILAIIAIPQYLDAVETARQTGATHTLQELRETGLMIQANSGTWPTTTSFTPGTSLCLDINSDGECEKNVTIRDSNTYSCSWSMTGQCNTTVGDDTITIYISNGTIVTTGGSS